MGATLERSGRAYRAPGVKALLLVTNVLVLLDLFVRYTEFMTMKTASSVAVHEAVRTSSAELPSMELPSQISEVFLNIGSNLDPILPPTDSGDKALTIAFEPIVGCKIPPHKQLMVVHAAVAATSGLTSMFLYNEHGVSSSLSKPAKKGGWNSNTERDGHIQVVPIITMRQILKAIPSHVAIPYIKTDMQGYDFAAVSSAEEYLFQRNVDYLFTEVYFYKNPTYEGVSNDFCTDWWPHMRRVGYDLIYMQENGRERRDVKAATEFCAQPLPELRGGNLAEGDALWKRKGAADRDFVFQSGR